MAKKNEETKKSVKDQKKNQIDANKVLDILNMSDEKKAKLKKKIDKKTKRVKKKFKKLLISLLILLVLLVISIIFTPQTEPEIKTEVDVSLDYIENLEIPNHSKDSQIIKHTGYTLSYSEEDEQPYWVAYTLTREKVNGTVPRVDNFRPDPYIKTGSATLADYRGSGYDRGHLIPAADLCYSPEAMDDSFYLSNMSPQVGAFNRNIWAQLESTVRNFANEEGLIYVVTGPVLTDGPYKTIGTNKVSVPNYYYKAILDYTEPETKAIGFLLKNEDSSNSLQSFAVSIDELEEITNIDFFPNLKDKDEKILESSFDTNLWDFNEFYRSNIDSSSPKPVKRELTPTEKILQSIQSILYKIFGTLKKEIVGLIEDLIQ